MLIYRIKDFHPSDAFYAIRDEMIGVEVILRRTEYKGKSDIPFHRKCYVSEIRDGRAMDEVMYFIAAQLQLTGRIYNNG